MESNAQLIPVATSSEVWNGVTVSDDGRIFVNYPRLEGDNGMRIGEIVNGKAVAYPDASWNDWKPGMPTEGRFVRTNSLRIGPEGRLWVVDTGTPSMGAPAIPGAAKLVVIDLHSNSVTRTIPLDLVMTNNSFIDDLRIYGSTIFLTDAGSPALVVMDQDSGKGRRVLENASSTTDQVAIRAEGKVMSTGDGQPVRIHADQLEVTPDGKWLYFQPASGPLYRVATSLLLDPTMTAAELASHVKEWYKTPSTGGTCIDDEGNIYVSDVNSSAIFRLSPEGKREDIIRDPRLAWGDALWIDTHGYLWVPVGQLNRLGVFQQGHSRIIPPLTIYKIRINARPFRS
ncbi:MAG TPA: L-dopachrome tautomerase-related protein [Puia sp.]|nr:L-dopachrome tautomerase-related protein [Puia sp.]